MEIKFNFNSQIKTSKIQSERLLALGLKRETADTRHYSWSEGFWGVKAIPAWSLHRLIEMMPRRIEYEGNTLYLTIYAGDVFYTNWKEHTPLARTLDLYEHLIWYIEWLIKEGHFNKVYLED